MRLPLQSFTPPVLEINNMAHYAIKMTDGSVAIMQTVGDATPEECLAKWHPDARAKVVSHKEIDPAAIPQSREFRNAWTLNGDKIEHDMAKAREIKRNQLRTERAPLMLALDVEQKRAMVAGDKIKVSAIEVQLQALRDAPANVRIDAATTVDELKTIKLP